MNRIGLLTGRLVLTAAMPALCSFTSTASAQDEPDAVRLGVYWESTKPEHALLLHGMLLMFHNGEIDLFDYHQPMPELPTSWLMRGMQPLPPPPPNGDPSVVSAFRETYPHAAIAWFWQQQFPGIAYPGPPRNHQHALMVVNPARHRFFSWFSMLRPSNDAFIGNEDPFQIEVFDENGRFRGPLYIDVYGNQVLDAGICANNETGIYDLDLPLDNPPPCQKGEGFVQIHPGLNGSLRNPDGEPKNILGNDNSAWPSPVLMRYDEVAADFTRPGYKLGRLYIDRRSANGHFTGSWYSPDRSGEGFNVEIVEPHPGEPRHRMMVSWYTFAPDGSGEQVWLTGIGEFDADSGVAADVPMILTRGGRFASTDNPELVERIPWGRIKLGFGDCNTGRVFYYPDDPAWPEGDYFIHRLSPRIEGLGFVCNPDDAHLVLPETPDP